MPKVQWRQLGLGQTQLLCCNSYNNISISVGGLVPACVIHWLQQVLALCTCNAKQARNRLIWQISQQSLSDCDRLVLVASGYVQHAAARPLRQISAANNSHILIVTTAASLQKPQIPVARLHHSRLDPSMFHSLLRITLLRVWTNRLRTYYS